MPLSDFLNSTHEHHFIVEHYQLIPYKVKLKTPWHTASAKLLFRQGLLIKLIINESLFAIGECAPMVEIGTETLQQAQQFLANKLPALLGKKFSLNSLSDMDSFPACRFALETALLSLVAQHTKKNIACLLNPKNSCAEKTPIKVNAMLGHLNNDLSSHARRAESQGFKCLKIKVGLDTIETEAKALAHLFQQLSSTILFRLDANKNWTVNETEWLLNFLKPYESRIDSIEEPLNNFDQAAYQYLQSNTKINLALDESFSSYSPESGNSPEQNNSFEQYPVKQLVLKPMAQGGIIHTLHLARQAQQSKIKTVITSSIETAHGLWPIAYLCAAINNQQFHGLATASWLENTLIKPPEIKHGIITL